MPFPKFPLKPGKLILNGGYYLIKSTKIKQIERISCDIFLYSVYISPFQREMEIYHLLIQIQMNKVFDGNGHKA